MQFSFTTSKSGFPYHLELFISVLALLVLFPSPFLPFPPPLSLPSFLSSLLPPSEVFENLHDYMHSLEKLLELRPSRLYPGHGPVVEDGTSLISHYLQHRGEREQQVCDREGRGGVEGKGKYGNGVEKRGGDERVRRGRGEEGRVVRLNYGLGS